MRTVLAAALLALAVPGLAIPPVPRASKEFTFVEPSGKQTLLTSLKGKVVIVQFLFTWCPHCQAFSKMLTGMQKDFSAKGVQFMGVAFDDNIAPAGSCCARSPMGPRQQASHFGAARPDAVAKRHGVRQHGRKCDKPRPVRAGAGANSREIAFPGHSRWCC